MSYGVEVELPDGREPTWEDCVVLNVGIGVVPWLRARILLGERDDDYEPIVHLRLSFDMWEARYKAGFVGLQYPDITSTDLREVKVAEYVRAASAGGIFMPARGDEPTTRLLHNGSYHEPDYTWGGRGEAIKAAGPADWVLELVAESYTVAHLSSQSPAKAVERQLGLAPRTAARWIAKAKARGILVRPAVPGHEPSQDAAQFMDRIAAAQRGELPWEHVGGIVKREGVARGEPEATS